MNGASPSAVLRSGSRHGHVARAARELHIAQPSLSKQIQALEAELGVVLFDRVGRRVELTEAGQLLLPYARRVLCEVAEARTALQQWGSLEHGQVAIGAPVGAHVLPRASPPFTSATRRSSCACWRWVRHGLRPCWKKEHRSGGDLGALPGLVSAELFSEELAWQSPGSPTGAAAGGAQCRAGSGTVYSVPRGDELRSRTLQFCRAAGFEPQVALDGGETDTVMRLVAAGLGVALAPRLALEGVAGIVGLHVVDVELQRTLRLIWHASDPAHLRPKRCGRSLSSGCRHIQLDSSVPVGPYGPRSRCVAALQSRAWQSSPHIEGGERLGMLAQLFLHPSRSGEQ